MADATTSNVVLSNFLLNSFCSIEGNTCKRCDESEIQLNEVLSELSSAQRIISILSIWRPVHCALQLTLQQILKITVLCNSADKYYTEITSDMQAPVSKDKSTTVAPDIQRKEGPRGEEIIIEASRKIPCDKKETICECCKNMVTELSEVKLELSSCKEIIRILQEEIHEISSSYQPFGNKAYEDSTNKKLDNTPIKEDWTYLASNRSRYSRLSRRNLRQLPLETSNPFAPLNNLNEDSEYPRYETS